MAIRHTFVSRAFIPPKIKTSAKGRVVRYFELKLKAEGLEKEFIKEYHFHEGRGWRADYACLKYRILIEIEGGIFQGGRHNIGASMLRDMEKYNQAAADGWHLLRFGREDQIRDTFLELFEQIKELESGRKVIRGEVKA